MERCIRLSALLMAVAMQAAHAQPVMAVTVTPAGTAAAAAATALKCNSLQKRLTYDCGTACLKSQLCYQQGSQCPYTCVSPTNDGAMALLFLRHGAYKSSQEIAFSKVDGSTQRAIAAINTATATSPSNDDISTVDVLSPPSSLTSFWLIGGTHDNLRGYVVNMTLTTGMLQNASSVSLVILKSLNLGDTAPKWRTLFPPALESLKLHNCLLTEVPTELNAYTSMQSITIRDNYLTNFTTDVQIPSLQYLFAGYNDLKSFTAVFPALQELYLMSNLLTQIPESIFQMPNLTVIDLRNNKIGKQRLTPSQFAFLSTRNLLLDKDIGDTACDQSNLRELITNDSVRIPICVVNNTSDAPILPTSSASSSSASEASSSSGGVSAKPTPHRTMIPTTIGIVIGVVLALALFLIVYKRRKSSSNKETSASTATPRQDVTEPVTSYSTLQEVPQPAVDILTMCSDKTKLQAWRYEAHEIADIKRLGVGGYGDVWLVKYQNKTMLASKRLLHANDDATVDRLQKFLANDDATVDRLQKFLAEIELNATLSHSRIVRFHAVAWTTGTDLQALFEYMENGDLRTWLMREDVNRTWTEQKLSIIIDIVEALVYVHSFKPPLVHRDLKSRNVLLSASLDAKLCDFGIARFQSQDSTMTVGVGTSRWLAPEVILCRQDYDQCADIYALGVVMSELDTHKLPYEGMVGPSGSAMPEYGIVHGVGSGMLKPEFLPTCPPAVLELAHQCLEFEPTYRPLANAVLHRLNSILAQMRGKDRLDRMSL